MLLVVLVVIGVSAFCFVHGYWLPGAICLLLGTSRQVGFIALATAAAYLFMKEHWVVGCVPALLIAWNLLGLRLKKKRSQRAAGREREASPCFLVDHMLIKLGAYLRILGCDASYHASLRTHELIGRANAERRVFLTRNTRLADQYPDPDRALVLTEDDPVHQLWAVVSAYQIDPQVRIFTRCIRCNIRLQELADLGDRAEQVPARVRERYERFWRCPSCDTIFWHGTHVENTCRKLGIPSP